jgi:hypothetical protein
VLRAMKEVSPESLVPSTPETEVVSRLEHELETVASKVAREERRTRPRKRWPTSGWPAWCARKGLESELERARARVPTQACEQMRQLHTRPRRTSWAGCGPGSRRRSPPWCAG